ncbi:MAG: tRNA (adenosine(37)-N6)-dimethylallyltransferase MiaA [bacterium]|jgi:tRNA dimethylallyltransferase
MSTKRCIIVVGPTAAGKTAEAIRIAKEYNTAIISADSRQCYKELNIGVARPSPEELATVKHYFIANHSVTEKITAATFEQEALEYLEQIFSQHDVAVVCGGTGLYIKALAEGLDNIPEIPDEIRDEVIGVYENEGIDVLRKKLLSLDPDFSEKGDISNPNRMMRALEVFLHTRTPIHQFQTGTKIKRSFEITYHIVNPTREILYTRINERVDQMITLGLEDEARSLIQYKNLAALQTVGYKEMFDFIEGGLTKSEAIEKIKQHTRNYAKRQITWFNKFAI